MAALIPPAAGRNEISITPIRIRWSVEDVLTADGHRLVVTFTCSVAIVDERADRKLFSEVFGGDRSAMDAVIAHFLPSLRSSAADVARARNAEGLMAVGTRPQWMAALKSAAQETAFSCGIEVLAPFDLEITSPTLQRERLEQMQRIAAERRSADRVGHLARAAELLKQWELLKSSVPSITPGKLLEQVNPADRGMMLDTLLMAGTAESSGKSPPDLWAVSGAYLVRIDVTVDSPQPKLIPLPSTAGPLRSVRADNGKLLIGARNGVLIADPANPDAAKVYRQPGLVSEHGFTSVTQIGDFIWACHRQGGLVSWKIHDAQNPAAVMSPADLGGEPKHLISCGLFAVGPKVFKLAMRPTVLFDAGANIVALLETGDQIAVVSETGVVTLLDRNTLESTAAISTAGRVSGAALLPWLSATRLLLNRTDGPIECIGLEDQLVTQFAAGHTGMRAVAAGAGKVAAMSSDRQRLLIWNAWDGRRTAGEVYLTGITHHRIADVVFG